jgi:hypothetical protein
VTMPTDDIEEWRPVVSAPKHYEVSNLGRVRRATFAPYAASGSTWAGRIRKPTAIHHNYQSMLLHVGGRFFMTYVHIMVAEAFLPPRPTLDHTVNHIDGDPSNNAVGNLEWLTPYEQLQHAKALGIPLGNPNHRH